MFGPKDLDFCFFDKCLGGVAQSTSGLLRRVTPALLRSLATKKPADVLPYSVCVAEDPSNHAREEEKRFRSRQTASKQGTNHSDSYSRRIDLPRSNAVAREARTFAYVPILGSSAPSVMSSSANYYAGGTNTLLHRPAVNMVKRTQVALEPNLKCWSRECRSLPARVRHDEHRHAKAKVGHPWNKATPDSC